MQAAVAALKALPAVNASWAAKAHLHKRVHLGVAVSVEGGLVVPVIRARRPERAPAGRALRDVAEHARAGKLAADEVRAAPSPSRTRDSSARFSRRPIINPPEAASWRLPHRRNPVAREGKIAVRHMMNLCLSYDHRIIDGELAIQFLQHIRATLEAAKFEMG